jgi:hypothetical protein
MDVAVTARAGGKLHARNALYALRAMHAYRLLGEYLGMTISTFHRLETAPVPAFCTNVAVETFRRAVWGALEVSHIDFVAIITGVRLFGVGRLQPEQQTGDQNGEKLANCSNHVSGVQGDPNGNRTASYK